jgi:hypothetical protein
MRHLLVGLGILLLSVPAGIILTIALIPFWRWLEETTGIESVGHSGPAEWCFLAGMGVCALVFASLARSPAGRGRRV